MSHAISPSRDSSSEALAPWTVVGRYVIEQQIGEGGMGVVSVAHDPELGRRVALKRVHQDLLGSGAHERLLREARAMARLSHPNVVALYDLVEHGNHLVLAMELVEGETLRAVISREGCDWQKILPLFRQAGKGLAAAHAVGLVHRDFKPDNVLVGTDGRARVTDFGLARAIDASFADLQAELADRNSPVPARDVLNYSVTRTGNIIGTAAYMAPEQHFGDVDARSDQFSFCVALYEALSGTLPFEGDNLLELRAAILGSHRGPKPLSTKSCPAWVQKIIFRGLSTDPTKRFPSMSALLAALDRDPAGRRRRWIATATIALAATTALVIGYRQIHARKANVCHADTELAGVWDGARKDAAKKSFDTSKKPYARDAWASVERSLDAYAASWTAMRVEACEATEIKHQQSAKLMDLRMACLGERREELREVVDQFSHADDALVTRAPTAASTLSSLDRCADARALHALAEPPPAAREKAAEMRTRLAKAKGMRHAGRFPEALAIAKQLADDVRPLAYPSFEAEILGELGDYEGLNGNAEAAEATLYKAAWTADAAGNDPARAWVWVQQLYTVGYMRKKRDMIPFLRDQATAAVKRVPGDVELDGALDSAVGSILIDDGKYAEARVVSEHQLAIHEEAHGKDCPHAYLALINIGLAYKHEVQLEKAYEIYQRALASAEKTAGPEHPDVATILTHMGSVRDALGDFTEAEARYRRAVAIAEGALGADSPPVSMHLGNLARSLSNQHRYAEAVPYAERALALREKGVGPKDAKLIYPLAALGEAYEGTSDHVRAAAVLERALALEDGGAPIAGPRVEAKFNLARALRGIRKGDRRARTLALEARAEIAASSKTPHTERLLASVDSFLQQRGATAARTTEPKPKEER